METVQEERKKNWKLCVNKRHERSLPPLRAASTLENTDCEQRALRVLRQFSASQNLSFTKRTRCFALSNS